MTRYFDTEQARWLTKEQWLAVDITDTTTSPNAERWGTQLRYIKFPTLPEVMLIHFVSKTEHDMKVLVNGEEVLGENHLDDAYHEEMDCATVIATRLSRALRTPIDERRIDYATWSENGYPLNEKLATLARSIPLPHPAASPE